MIDPKECRLGNLAIDSEGGYSIIEPLDFAYMNFNELSPVELSGDILLKMGFAQEGSHFIKDIGALKLELYNHTKWYGNFGGIYLGDRLQYVHELQNFYHSWLKRELPIDNLLK